MQVGEGEAAAVGEDHRGRGGQRQQGPDHDPAGAGMRAKHGVRVVVEAGDDSVDLRGVHLGRQVRGTGAGRPGLAAPGHAVPSAIEPSGMGSQEGRSLASYITS